jgi:uncharacterized membrane protein HdeD (DUF308 family)
MILDIMLPESSKSKITTVRILGSRVARMVPRLKACAEPFTSAAPCAMLWPVTAYAAESTDSESPLERLARRGWWFLLILGVAAVIIGLVVLIWPSQTLRVVGVLFGIYLLVSGLMEILLAFVPGLRGGARFLSALTGVLSILLGLISFRGAAESILLLALWIGFGWLIVGISRAVAAASTPYLPFRGWQIFGGILLAIGGIIIIVAPFQSIFALAVFSGIWLIVIGVWQIVEAFITRSNSEDLVGALG